DLRTLKSQALAVALVMACGLAMMIMTRSLIRSLEEARSTYYQKHRFGDVFVSPKRAPEAVSARLAEIPGVAGVEPSIAMRVLLDLPSMREPASGLINSLPDHRPILLERPYVRRGRLPDGRAPLEAAVSEAFAEEHGIQPGDTLAAILNGRRITLRLDRKSVV